MSTVIDFDEADFALDMGAVVKAALAPKALGSDWPVWRVDFDCHGAPFTWQGTAPGPTLATTKARAELSDTHATFSRFGARVVACVQVAA